jgi:non-specific protein-tyrosine kinase
MQRSAFSILKRRIGYVVIFVAAAVAIAYVLGRERTPVYEASGLAQLTTSQQASGTFISQDAVNQITNQYGELATSANVLQPAARRAGLTPDALASKVSVASQSAGILRFEGRESNPDRAADYTFALMRAFVNEVARGQAAQRRQQIRPLDRRIEALTTRLRRLPEGDPETSVLSTELQALQTRSAELLSQPSDRVSLLRTPRASASPISPSPVRDAAIVGVLAALLGCALVYGVALARDRFDSADDASRDLNLPVLAEIPRGTLKSRRVIEAFRTLRTSLTVPSMGSGAGGRPGTVLLITGSDSGVGKTYLTTGLSRAFGLADTGVAAVDGDLRRPSLHRVFKVPQNPGLADVLGGDELATAVHEVAFENNGAGPSEIQVLPAGQTGVRSSEALASHHMRRVLDGLRSEQAVVLVDSPPVLSVTDPIVLSGYSDGVLLVVDARRSRRRETGKALQMLQANGARVVGMVYNRVPAAQRSTRPVRPRRLPGLRRRG